MEARVGRTRTGVVGAGEEGMNICVLCTRLVLVDLTYINPCAPPDGL